MKPVHAITCLTLLLAAASAAAQMYKWVGPDGKINYTDTPPPKNAIKVESKNLKGIGSADADLPFEVAQAARNHPVTLFTTAICTDPCNSARNLLKTRGIPFTEKTVNTIEDQAKFQKMSSALDFPLLLVGRAEQRGFEAGAWNAELTAAGYPETSSLPKGYQFRKPEPAAPAAAPKPPPAAVEKKPDPEPVAPTPVDERPPGIQF